MPIGGFCKPNTYLNVILKQHALMHYCHNHAVSDIDASACTRCL